MRTGRAVAVLLAAMLATACGSDDGGDGDDVSLPMRAGGSENGGLGLAVRLGPQEGDQAAFEGGGFSADGSWDGDDITLVGDLDLAPAGAELTPTEEQAYRSSWRPGWWRTRCTSLGGARRGLRGGRHPRARVGTVVAPVVVVDDSGIWQPVELVPLLAEGHRGDRGGPPRPG